MEHVKTYSTFLAQSAVVCFAILTVAIQGLI
jgi:hypothetical protein